VWDAAEETWAIVTDVRQQNRDRPEYMLRLPSVLAEQWTTTDVRRLHLDGPE
jgi:hypothetical protein